MSSLDSTAGIHAVLQNQGNTEVTGTWAHPDIALAYAAVIDIIHQF
ncbi:hypothetical protein DQR71_08915 [Salmonella enterica subsp. enterica serovar Kingston]|nr:hypothetical protein [Salmonella enterica subsp. enterica serovar Kingston]